ncbi:MAG: hypothetical protein AMXMBFR13_07070 [Phycisphaerae bacterium]
MTVKGSGSNPENGGVRRYWLVFDGQCRFCRSSVGWIKRLDWLGRIEPLDLHVRKELISARAPDLTHEAMMQAMQLLTPDRQVFAGFFAFRRAAWLLPVFWILLPLLYVPGMSRLGPAVYGWIARRRYGLVRCEPDGTCRL